jgi:large subunit ribosomal protein L25
MSGEDISLVLSTREQIGKGLGKLKREGRVPTVIHASGKDSIPTSGAYIELVKVYQTAGKHHPVHITVGTTKYLTIIKEVDYDPKKHTLRHVVFGTIDKNVKVETEVPVHLEGDAPAQKKSMLVIKQLDHIKLEALPKDLPDSVTLNIEKLSELGDKLLVSDITVQTGVAILTDPELVVAIVEETPAQESEEAAEEAVVEAPAEEVKEES